MMQDIDELNKHFAKEEILQEKVQAIINRLYIPARSMIATMQMIHCETGFKSIPSVCLEARSHLVQIKKDIHELQTVLPEFDFYRFVEVWQNIFRRLIFLVSLLVYLEEDRLVSAEEFSEIIGLDKFSIDEEIFITAWVDLSKELIRFATNSVTYQDYNKPARILDFVNKLYACVLSFDIDEDDDDQQLLKNIDYIKNNLRSIEKVVYSLSIRKLLD
ncbi:translin-like [Nilaparvata lugens]|uniref:translin-like n=1 Tax=Nilaparvata lugens TaxID=108931 RepID=UPI00193DDE81|nr:translin-like [Nilaparvata lugens]